MCFFVTLQGEKGSPGVCPAHLVSVCVLKKACTAAFLKEYSMRYIFSMEFKFKLT